MSNALQPSLLGSVSDVDAFRVLVGDLYDDVGGKLARLHQMNEICSKLGSEGTMLHGGEVTLAAWTEARSSFVHGNFMATVLLCQGLAEHLLAAYLSTALCGDDLPERISFQNTLQRCITGGYLSEGFADELRRLMALRNPLTHFRGINDANNLSRRVINSGVPADEHLLVDATFALHTAVNILALPMFKLDK